MSLVGEHPYSVGKTVAGADCLGKPFTGTVTETIGRYTVKLDDLYITPVLLIRGVVDDGCPLGADLAPANTAQIIPKNITAPADEPVGQLSLF